MAEQALYAGDSRAFELMVQQMMSPQNETRDEAEKVFSRVKDRADLCIGNLMRMLRTQPDQSLRAFSAVLLRKVCTCDSDIFYLQATQKLTVVLIKTQLLAKEDPSLWSKCSPEIQVCTNAEDLTCLACITQPATSLYSSHIQKLGKRICLTGVCLHRMRPKRSCSFAFEMSKIDLPSARYCRFQYSKSESTVVTSAGLSSS